MAVLKWLLGSNREKDNFARESPAIRASDSASWDDDDLIKGATFYATLSLTTPLRYLEEHGRTYAKAEFEVEPQFGIWMPEVRTFLELGVNIDDPPTGTMASQIGSVPKDGGELLDFLKDFRRIVESGDDLADQIAQLQALYDLRPEYNQFRQHFSHDLARRWYCSCLTRLPGVGLKTAESLFDAGLRTPEEVQIAPDSQLLNIPGIGQSIVAKIRAVAAPEP